MWPFFDPAMWAEYLRSQGVDPAHYTPADYTTPEPVLCELCSKELPSLYVLIDPPPGTPYGRKFHIDCFVNHLILNIDNQNDELISFALRKPIKP